MPQNKKYIRLSELPIAEEEGLRFNGNILETNIKNLAVVIGLLVYLGSGFRYL